MTPIRTILTDIEGTTSAIAFVKETLFPFALAALDGFLDAHGAEPEVAAIMAEPDVDGCLVGGASLDPDEFVGIVRYRLLDAAGDGA